MRLTHSPKLPSFNRGKTPQQTLDHVQPLMSRLGITRVADITGLDHVGLPVWSAVVPKSSDILSVYNGKGMTHIGAKVGAIMEAFERQCALADPSPSVRPPPRAAILGSYAVVSKKRRALDPTTMILPLIKGYTADTEIAWTVGHDLWTAEEILVPFDLVWMGSHPQLRAYSIATSNGLSAGNTYEEAVAQGLLEIVERDAWTIAEILSHWLPRARWDASRRKEGTAKSEGTAETEQPFDDDAERYPELDPDTFTGDLRKAYQAFVEAGLPVTLREVSCDMGIPTVIAIVIEEVAPDLPRSHLGAGAHFDPTIAALRALTEAAQSRAVDIQGVREDMSDPSEKVPIYMAHTKRVSRINRKNWLIMKSARKRAFSDLPRIRHEDTLDDIKLILERLRTVGLDTVIEVDLTSPELGVPVSRVIVPGAESWAADHSRLGKRSAKFWNQNRNG